MGAQRVAIDWDGLERALTRRSRESEAFLDTRTGDIIWVTRGWTETSGRGKHIELDLPDGALDYVVIREDITNGHIVRAFTVSIDGKEVYLFCDEGKWFVER